MIRASTVLRRVLKTAAAVGGLLSVPRRPGVAILAYHRVGGGTDQELDVPTARFASHMRYLREHCSVVSLDELLAAPQGSGSERDVVAVTFDDGYEDVYLHAFPILQEYEIPATVYVSTAFVDAGRPFPWSGDTARPLNWGQLAEMKDSGLVTIGAHTHSHAPLGKLRRELIAEELRMSAELIEKRLGSAPAHFSYPMPSREVGDPSLEVARDLVEARYATVAVEGFRKNYLPLSLHRLTRIPVQGSDTFLLFRLGLGGYLAPMGSLLPLFRRLRAAFRSSPGRGAAGPIE